MDHCLIFKAIVLLLLGTATGIFGQYDPDSCVTPNGLPGQCVVIYECAGIIKLLQNPRRTPQDLQYVQKSGCGFEGSDPKVCCGSQGATNTNNNFNNGNNGNQGGTNLNGNFNTNNGNNGNQGTGNFNGDFNNNGNSGNQGRDRADELLPSDCGDPTINDKIVGGVATAIDEFPWMALLEYKKPRGTQTACGGVLISKRYVLTAAHCIVKSPRTVPYTWSLVNIRLGEYNTKTNPDCVPDGNYEETCNDPLVNVPVEEEIVHEDYIPDPDKGYRHDIALVRLARDVKFTPFIKAICLPNTERMDDTFFIAGWGQTEYKSSSEIKLKATVNLSDRRTCEEFYSSNRINLGDGQICAGGQKGVDSCKGDSGGPLMELANATSVQPQWVVRGVVSFGPSPCGHENWAGVYTNVYKYKDWILSKLKP